MSRQRLAALVVALLAVGAVAVPAVAQQSDGVQRAELSIDQPHYVDGDVSVSRGPNVTTYEVNAPAVQIHPQNFAPGNVVDAGVDGPGSLSFNEQRGRYEFSADATNGTRTLYWIVAEERTITANNTTETEIVQVRYEARLTVQRANLVHLEQSEFRDTQERAANWSELVATIRDPSVAGPNADIEATIQTMVNLLQLRNDPFRALSGDITAIVTLLTLTQGGLFLLLVTVVVHLGIRYADIRSIRSREQVDAERGSVEDLLEEFESEQNKQALETMTWAEILPSDRLAKEFRETFGPPLDGFMALYHSVAPRTLVHDRLRLMGADGWVGVAEREDTASDGIPDSDGERAIETVRLVPADECDLEEDHDDRIDLTALDGPEDPVVDAVDWEADPLLAFDPTSVDADSLDDEVSIDTVLRAPDVDELTEDLLHEWDRLNEPRETYAEYLVEFLRTVEQSEFVSDGDVDSVRQALNLLLRTDHHLDEQQRAPFAGLLTDAVETALAAYDPEAETAEQVQRLRREGDGTAGGVSGD